MIFSDLIELAGRRRLKLIFACTLHAIACGLAIIPFYLIYLLFLEVFSTSPNEAQVWWILALIPVVYVAMSAVLVYAYNISHVAAYQILYKVRIQLGKKLSKLSLGFFDDRNTGELKTVINENVEMLEFFLAHHLPEMISTIAVPVFLGIFLFIMDWRMALASVLPVALALTVIIIKGRGWGEMIDAYLEAQSQVNSTVVEYVQGIKVIKAFNQTAESFKKYQENMAFWKDSVIKWSRQRAAPFSLYQGLITSTLTFIIPIGLWLYIRGELTIETFLLFLIIGPTFGGLFMRIYEFLRYGMEEKECMDRINNILDAENIDDSGKKGVETFDITFKNVFFGYNTRKPVLNDINFHVPQGTRCALVGPSGSGKTTIARLMARFWDVDYGKIMIGGCDLRELSLKNLLSYVSIVLQDPYLFNDTVLENIKIGNPDATMDEVVEVSRAARCHEFIEDLPDGYLTVVGERGEKLSGGEKQRISIARALLKDAPIVILDEATVFIDPENESLIQDAIGNLTRNKTVLAIAHKLYTITDAEQILVLREGEIVEQGSYNDLMDITGLFREMWDTHISTLNWELRGDGIV
jgi:ATP-binding cassette subfamily B protein